MTSSQSSAWAAWDISACNSLRRWDSTPWPLRAARTRLVFAKELGAAHYIDSTKQDVSAELQKLGGAKLILATVTDAEAMSTAANGLGYGGKLVIVGVPMEPVQVSVMNMIMNRQSVHGWASGTAIDSEDTLKFSAMQHVLPMIERYPLEKAAEAYDRMMSGKARFRVVLTMAG